MPADVNKSLLQSLIGRPKDSDALQVMQDIHSALTDRAPLPSSEPLLGPLFLTYGAFVDRGLAGDAFKDTDITQAAIQLTASLADIYLPVFKTFAPLGKASKKLARHLLQFDTQLPAPSLRDDSDIDPELLKHWAVKTVYRPSGKRWIMKPEVYHKQ